MLGFTFENGLLSGVVVSTETLPVEGPGSFLPYGVEGATTSGREKPTFNLGVHW